MNTPAWSVVVPTYNRPQSLARCLAALTRLDPPAGGFEIVVVNDGGNDFDDALRRAVQTHATPPVRMVSQPHAGPGVARNHGVELARGTWLAFTDDDCEPERGWLHAFERALAAQPDALAGGATRNVVDSIFSETSQLLVSFVSDWFDGTRHERLFTTNNLAVARAAFLEAGSFNPRFGASAAGEDREFCDRWSAQCRPSCGVAGAIVHHAHPLSLPSFLRQHFAYGRAGRLFRRVRRDGGRPIRIDPGFYIASLRHAGRVRPLSRGARLTILTAVAHAAYVAGLARESLRRDTMNSRAPQVAKENRK